MYAILLSPMLHNIASKPQRSALDSDHFDIYD